MEAAEGPIDVRRPALAVGLVLLTHAGLLAWGAARHSPTIDEVAHLPAGIDHWRSGRFDLYRVNPPLVRMLASLPVLAASPVTEEFRFAHPASRAEFAAGGAFIQNNGPRAFRLFLLARWACIPLSLLAGWVSFRWATALYGPGAGMLALCLWCFGPNVLAHGQLITPDVGAAALGVGASYLFWRWLHEPRLALAVLAGVALGLAQLSKTTWVFLVVLWPVLWLAWRRWPGGLSRQSSWARDGLHVAAMLLVALVTVNLGYGFEGSFRRLGDYQFLSRPLSGRTDQDPRTFAGGNRFRDTWLGQVPVPLPENYVLGIDFQKREFELERWSYLRGEFRQRGWWYYYLYALAVKVPLGTWVLAFLALAVTLGRSARTDLRRDELVLLAPAVVLFVWVSSQTGFSHHLRYVLPAFPFAAIWIGQSARLLSGPARPVKLLAGAALSWSVASSLVVYPHSLSYFNELTGGPKGGHRHLLDSNIDWGQDLFYLTAWLDAHPEARPLRMLYHGFFRPELAGLKPIAPPEIIGNPGKTLPAHRGGPEPGWYALSVCWMYGYGTAGFGYYPQYTYFRRFQPVATAGYSIYIFHVTLDEANRVRRELDLAELDRAELDIAELPGDKPAAPGR